MAKPNILLITVDSLRRDFVGVYGERDVETPTMDVLAKEGDYIDTAVANAPYTAASFPAIMFGKLLPNSTKDTYRVEGESLASLLKDKGYETAAFHSNPYLREEYGYGKGFQVFESFSGETAELDDGVTRLKEFLKDHELLGKLIRIPYYYYTHWKGVKPFLGGEDVNEAFHSWLKSSRKPFFAWVHYMDVHHPYMPEETDVPFHKRARIMRKMQQREELTEEELDIARKLYKKKVEEVDRYISEVIEAVQDSEGETVIVLTSDHGEAFGEHGFYMHRPRLYDEVLKAPFITNIEGEFDEGQYNLRNLKPFLSKIAEGEEPDLSLLKSESVYSICKDLDDNISVSERTVSEKYIVKQEGLNEVYDLEEDPGETENLIGERQGEEREERIMSTVEKSSGETIDKDEEVRRRLEKLGYY